jgi:hypothetical protein
MQPRLATNLAQIDLPRQAGRVRELPTWVWIGLPLGVVAAQVAVRLLDWPVQGQAGFYWRVFENENGVVENATALLAFCAFIVAIIAARAALAQQLRAVALALILFALGSLFLAGEEISWGQNYFGWETPEYFLERNSQEETNLHNLEGFGKKRLRDATLIGMGLGGLCVIVSLVAGLRWTRGSGWLLLLLPTRACLPVTLLAAAIRTIVGVYGAKDIETKDLIGIDLRENLEFCIAMFLFTYALSLRHRLRQVPQHSATVIGP